jgi:hypothetical protein
MASQAQLSSAPLSCRVSGCAKASKGSEGVIQGDSWSPTHQIRKEQVMEPLTNGRNPRRPLLGLVADLWRQSASLLREEAELAKAEISEKLSEVGSAIGFLAIGGAILFAGFLLVLLAVVALVGPVLPEAHATWLAPLLVGAVVLFAGGLLLYAGLKKLQARNLKSSRTVRALQRDAEVVTDHIN